MPEIEIVHDQNGERVVRVFRNFSDGIVSEINLVCDESSAEIVRMTSVGSPESIAVAASVMDRIAESWQRYRADEEKRKADEEAQMEADATQAIAEAYEIARECPAIKIKEHPGPQWEVSVPKMGYRFERVVQWPSDLLWQARTARTAYDNWIEDQKEYARREASGSF